MPHVPCCSSTMNAHTKVNRHCRLISLCVLLCLLTIVTWQIFVRIKHVKKELLEELVDLKLKFLYDEIDKILIKWKYESASQFLLDAKDGTIEEAEDDAITLKHLIDQREELSSLKREWNNN